MKVKNKSNVKDHLMQEELFEFGVKREDVFRLKPHYNHRLNANCTTSVLRRLIVYCLVPREYVRAVV